MLSSDRLDETVAILSRLNIDVACLISGPNAGLRVITRQEMSDRRGHEQELLASACRLLHGS